MYRIALIVVFSACHLYFNDPAPVDPLVDAGAQSTSSRLALPCIQAVASGDILPDAGDELFVAYGCTGGPVVADIAYRSGELLASGLQAQFQLRFQRAVVADLDGIPPADVLSLDRYSSGWAFTRREFSGRQGNSFKFERPFEDVVVTDLDGDHKRDMVLAGDGALRLVADASSTPYGPVPLVVAPAMETEILTGRQFAAVVAADLASSPAKDLFFVATQPAGGYELGVATQVGPLAFDVTSSATPSGPLQKKMLVADVDGDGQDDIVGLAGRLFVHGSKHGTIALLPAANVISVDIGDLDGDGQAEPIAIIGDEVHRITVHASGPVLSLASTPVLPEGGDELHVVSLDGDMHDDLVLVRGLGEETSELVLYLGASL